MQQATISDQDKAQLKRTFRKDLKAAVNLQLFTQRPSPISIPGRDCKYCPQTQQMMEELAALSPKIGLETVDMYAQPDVARDKGITRIPAIVLGEGSSDRLRFFGIPLGYQLTAIVETIKTISKGTSPLSMATRKQLRTINHPVHLQVFVTPNSAESTPMARLAHALALENKHITADVIEAEEFQALAQNYGVRAVPHTVINEYIRVPGLVAEDQMLAKVLEAGVRQGQEPA